MPRIHLPEQLRRFVLERAQGRCEYCHIHQDDAPEPHHVDHLIAVKHGGQTVETNLALACARCNRYKGSDLAAMDPLNNALVPLYNPRTENWAAHFQLNGPNIIGLTATGRATALLLRMNDDAVLVHRRALQHNQRYPI
jgi:hypothetical protein